MTTSEGHDKIFEKLVSLLCRVPAVVFNETVSKGIGTGDSNGRWWVKFEISIAHPLAWSTVQEFGHVLNELSITEKLPTVFMPVSPAPYLNGGPEDFLSWVIENTDESFTPDDAAAWLESRLPNPVEDMAAWQAS
jgi:hypothetical protein